MFWILVLKILAIFCLNRDIYIICESEITKLLFYNSNKKLQVCVLTLSELWVLSTACELPPCPLLEGMSRPLGWAPCRGAAFTGMHCLGWKGGFSSVCPRDNFTFYHIFFNLKLRMHQEWNSFYRRGYPGRFPLQWVPGPQLSEASKPPLKPGCWRRRTNLQQEIDKKDFLVKNFCKQVFPAAAQLVSHGGGQEKVTWSEVQPAQVLWDVMIKFSISDLKKPKTATCFSA